MSERNRLIQTQEDIVEVLQQDNALRKALNPPLKFPGRPDRKIESAANLDAVLDRITLTQTSLAWKWEFKFRNFEAMNPRQLGWLVHVEFERVDSDTGNLGVGSGREEIVMQGATETSVVKTCWLLLELVVRHELMEAFRFEGKRVFDPHNSVDDLINASRRT